MYFFFFQAEDGIRDLTVTGVQTWLFRSGSVRIGFGVTVALAVMFLIYVGMETSIGVWSAEYARRLAHGISNMTTLAPMFFYAGLTSGRGLAPLVLLRLAERRMVLGALSLAGLGTTLVIFSGTLNT